MARKFRQKAPVRTFKKTYATYTDYKPYLQTDFNKRCGYTDCSDLWFGGVGTFHIDHHKPWKKYPKEPNLKTDYANLVYCCSYVNILKSDDIGDYIDPCDIDYNDHFERGKSGEIIPMKKSKPANYMYTKLKLYLQRYEIIWTLDNLFRKMQRMEDVIAKETDKKRIKDLRILQGELAGLFVKQLQYLGSNQ